MSKDNKNILLKLLKGLIITLINYIINCYRNFIKKTIFEELSEFFTNLIETFKLSTTIGASFCIIWYICCLIIFNNKTIFLKLLGVYRDIIIHEYIILLIHKK